MSSPIEDYALDRKSSNGCAGRPHWFDRLVMYCPGLIRAPASRLCLETDETVTWLLAPKADVKQVRRRYRDEHANLLETEFETEGGVATVIDFMTVGIGRTRSM